ncbi:MAG: RRXRR domain-containing protein [Oscillospiraceae bacterium]|nr:RRXRR domain-containing protein [Oscillospiraceae bacterium]
MTNNLQTVTVIDNNGKKVGTTYPKRARGLCKKGRATFVTDNIIRLTDSPMCNSNNDYTEELPMDSINNNIISEATETNYIFFDPRKWIPNPDSNDSNVVERYFIKSPIGNGMTEVITLGNWMYNWSEIMPKDFIAVKPNTDYEFVFWANGGENDRGDASNEICQCHVLFPTVTENGELLSGYDDKLVFKLNRDFIEPLKHHNGWLLFSIPIHTGDSELMQIRFVSMGAPFTVMHADKPEAYADLEENFDPYADKRPQRHNIVFKDGFPTNKWYSTANLASESEKKGSKSNDYVSRFRQEILDSIDIDVDDIADNIAESIAGEIDADEIAESIAASIEASIAKYLK